MDVSKKNIGLSFHRDHWNLRVWAPEAFRVQLMLAIGTLIDLVSKEYGYWELNTQEISEGDKYWLIADGKTLPDPASVAQPDGVHGPSQANSLEFPWTDSNWKNIPLQEYIFYELHTGTFSASGTFKGISEKLDYLLELGITAIEIMPVAAFPGQRNWGYDGVFPFAVQCTYGGPQDLQELINLCHKKGIAVVLDVVYNHLGPEGNFFQEFGPYFTDKYRTPWGNAVNFDDRDAHGVREYFIENVLMWFRDFHVDALRLDAVHAIKDFSATHILQEIRRRTDELTAYTGKPYHLIAECDLNDPRYITSLKSNGLGMDAQWVDEFHHALRVTAGEPKQGYYSDFNGIEHLGKSYRDAYVYTGMYSAERQNFFGRSAEGHPASQFIVFSQNHDQVGNRMLGERSSVLFSFELQKLMAAAVLLSPFQPLLFMGEEWGETNPFQYFIDHTDPDLVNQVRQGRKDEFAAMHQSGTAPDPKDEQTFLKSKLNWELPDQGRNKVLLAFYKQLIALRKHHPGLKMPDLEAVRVYVHPEKNCLVVLRGSSAEQEQVLCLLNFSSDIQQLYLPTGLVPGKKLIDSADHLWQGPITANEHPFCSGQELNYSIVVQPQSFLAYSANYV